MTAARNQALATQARRVYLEALVRGMTPLVAAIGQGGAHLLLQAAQFLGDRYEYTVNLGEESRVLMSPEAKHLRAGERRVEPEVLWQVPQLSPHGARILHDVRAVERDAFKQRAVPVNVPAGTDRGVLEIQFGTNPGPFNLPCPVRATTLDVLRARVFA